MADVYQGIPVDRTKSCGLTKELIANALDTSRPKIMILPEGASTSGDYMLRFHLGAFLTDLPVQPVTLRYTLWGTSRKISNISFFHNYKNHILAFLSIPFITLDFTFLEPMNIKSDGENDPRKFADNVSLRIANTLGVRLLSLGTSVIYKKKEPPSEEKPANK
jgi:1-acyl-sn-glycerol-3-phosphate acyltransferase